MSITDLECSTNAITAKVSAGSAAPGWLTVVYGPQEDTDKIAFLHELRDIRSACQGP